ncbi:hypothetical protein LO772_10985 [Yinghuangia sp. ASG 101]|uniref:hypothetical protein n=1 Tax=Yinghuangia sp. ASG 101 TaxID=2896848 RepID=UPI001E47E38B|nr:hypothetical protein [Yinghuangia sp. ASG 101]UGQ14074.1 hypothetical protein LO772_10985 [Yinghuangia sp. ASG 101]
MPVNFMPMLAFVALAVAPCVAALRRTPKADPAPDIPLNASDLHDVRRMLHTAYEEERDLLHEQAVRWLGSLGRAPLRVTDAHPAPRGLGGDTVVLSDGTVLCLSDTGEAIHELVYALDRFVEVALTRVRAARDGFQLTFDIEGHAVHASAELLTVRGADV